MGHKAPFFRHTIIFILRKTDAMIFTTRRKIMAQDIKYIPFSQGNGFYAYCGGHTIGKITFVRTGPNTVIIDHTEVEEKYRNSDVELNLVRCVCEMARDQHRNVLPMCPIARTMFSRYPEFDDVRMLRTR